MQDTLIELETKIAYQEDLLQELNSVLIRHNARIEKLEAQHRYLAEQLAEQREGGVQPQRQVDEAPPHY
ncbi:MAG: hypothetical protein DHS20C12_29460 [Pseudohongiella sp.]|nr:MAG: hypothetical protein DHS20C12_29460 [Pseudohongiella sp.]